MAWKDLNKNERQIVEEIINFILKDEHESAYKLVENIFNENSLSVILNKIVIEKFALIDADYVFFKKLLSKGADVNYSDEDLLPSLHVAAKFGNVELLNFLIANKVNFYLRSWKGLALLYSIKYKNKYFTHSLLKLMRRLDAGRAYDVIHETLHHVTLNETPDVLSFFLELKLIENINFMDDTTLEEFEQNQLIFYDEQEKKVFRECFALTQGGNAGHFALFTITRNSEEEVVAECVTKLSILKENGLDFSHRNRAGDSVYDVMKKYGLKQKIDELELVVQMQKMELQRPASSKPSERASSLEKKRRGEDENFQMEIETQCLSFNKRQKKLVTPFFTSKSSSDSDYSSPSERASSLEKKRRGEDENFQMEIETQCLSFKRQKKLVIPFFTSKSSSDSNYPSSESESSSEESSDESEGALTPRQSLDF